MAPWFAGVYPRGRPCLAWHRRYEITKCRRITANLRYGFSLSLSVSLLTGNQTTAVRDLRAKRRLTISAVSAPALEPTKLHPPSTDAPEAIRNTRLPFISWISDERAFVCMYVCMYIHTYVRAWSFVRFFCLAFLFLFVPFSFNLWLTSRLPSGH